MTQVQATDSHGVSRIQRYALPLTIAVALAAVAILFVDGWADLLKSAVEDGPGREGGPGKFRDITGAITDVQKPLTIGLGSMVSVGLLAGGIATATGVGGRIGMRLITVSGLSGAVVLVGSGIAQ